MGKPSGRSGRQAVLVGSGPTVKVSMGKSLVYGPQQQSNMSGGQS